MRTAYLTNHTGHVPAEVWEAGHLSCLHTILDEEWEHHRYAVRGLDAIEAKHDA